MREPLENLSLAKGEHHKTKKVTKEGSAELRSPVGTLCFPVPTWTLHPQTQPRSFVPGIRPAAVRDRKRTVYDKSQSLGSKQMEIFIKEIEFLQHVPYLCLFPILYEFSTVQLILCLIPDASAVADHSLHLSP